MKILIGVVIYLFSGSYLYSQQPIQNKISKVKHNSAVINFTDKRGLRQGYWKISMPDHMGHTSNILSGFYYNGKKIGVWTLSNYSGQVIHNEIYYDTSGYKVEFKEYHLNGQLKSTGFYFRVYQRDTISIFDERAKAYSNYVTDSVLKKQNKWSYFYDNGLLESQGLYENDKKVGIWKYFNKKGELIKEETY